MFSLFSLPNCIDVFMMCVLSHLNKDYLLTYLTHQYPTSVGLPRPLESSGLAKLCYNTATESFHTKKLCSRLYSTEIEFYSQKGQIRFSNHTLGDLGVTYAVRTSKIAEKTVIECLFGIIEHFPLSLMVAKL